MKRGGKKPDSLLQDLRDKNRSLETQVKHLKNDLELTKREYEKTLQNYFDLYSDLAIRSQELQKLKEQSERESRELQTMLDASPAMIYYKNINLRFIRVNRLFAETLCRSPGEIIGNTYEELFPDKQNHELQDDLTVMQNSHPILKKSLVLETEIDHRELVVDKYPYLDADGSVIGVITFALDMTDLRKVQQQKHQIDVRNLRAKNGEATITLMNNLVHHFNAALETILYNTNSMAEKLAEEHTLYPFIQNNLTAITNVENSLQLMVEYASPENYSFTKSNFISVLEHTRQNLEEQSLSLPQQIDVKVEGTRDIVFPFDTEKMKALFHNLGNSALSMFSEQTGGEIHINLLEKTVSPHSTSQLFPGKYVVVKISDTSEIDSLHHYSERLQLLFSEHSNHNLPDEDLSQAYWIIQNHHGYIEIQNTEKNGKTLSVYFPITPGTSENL